MSPNPRFVVRVYALIVQDGCLLISRETYQHAAYVKLPGGGMELFEGPEDTLKRELKEEMDAETDSIALFAAYPGSIVSRFHPDQHIVCLYYRVKLATPFSLEQWQADPRFAHTDNQQELFWIPLADVRPELFSLGSEQYIASLIHPGISSL